jgi:hypothetical protein
MIHFAGQRWSAEPDPAHERRAKNPRLPAPLRVVEASKARANSFGHAAFHGGQLQRWLAGHNGRMADARNMRRAISTAKDWGMLAPVSTARCLVLVREEWTRAYGRMSACAEPSHEGHRYQEWLRETGDWGIWQPARRLAQARAADNVEEMGGLYIDQETGQLVDAASGEVLADLAAVVGGSDVTRQGGQI